MSKLLASALQLGHNIDHHRLQQSIYSNYLIEVNEKELLARDIVAASRNPQLGIHDIRHGGSGCLGSDHVKLDQ